MNSFFSPFYIPREEIYKKNSMVTYTYTIKFYGAYAFF